MMAKHTADNLERGLAIVELVSRRRYVTLPEVCQRFSLPKTTAYRLLSTLEEHGWLSRRPRTSGYWLGPRLMHLTGMDALSRAELASEPLLADLALTTQETANLAVMLGDRLVYGRVVLGPRSLRKYVEVGASVAIHATGLGKAYLSALSDEDAIELLGPGPYQALTDRTLTTVEEVLQDVRLTRERGWGIDDGESEEGADCVAAAVVGADGAPIGAVSVAGPDSRFRGTRRAILAEQVVRVAREVSGHLAAPERLDVPA